MPLIDDYVTDVLMRDLVGHDKRPVGFLVYLWLAAEQARRVGRRNLKERGQPLQPLEMAWFHKFAGTKSA